MNGRDVIPDPWHTTITALPSGTVIITQYLGDGSEQSILIPREWNYALCNALHHASCGAPVILGAH